MSRRSPRYYLQLLHKALVEPVPPRLSLTRVKRLTGLVPVPPHLNQIIVKHPLLGPLQAIKDMQHGRFQHPQGCYFVARVVHAFLCIVGVQNSIPTNFHIG